MAAAVTFSVTLTMAFAMITSMAFAVTLTMAFNVALTVARAAVNGHAPGSHINVLRES